MTDVVVNAHAVDGRVHGLLKAIALGVRVTDPTSPPGGE
jgi:hypothetical protein